MLDRSEKSRTHIRQLSPGLFSQIGHDPTFKFFVQRGSVPRNAGKLVHYALESYVKYNTILIDIMGNAKMLHAVKPDFFDMSTMRCR